MKRLILDLDTGVDDAMALAYALAQDDVDLLGICATYGNVSMERSMENTLKVLHALGADDVPVFPGVPGPPDSLDYVPSPETRAIHGENGLGEAAFLETALKPQDQTAVDFLLQSALAYGPELIYVPTGPLTNLAAALERAPWLGDAGMAVVSMGGALTVPGNVSPSAEANIAQDPEGAAQVYSSGLPMTMVGLDVTHRTVLTRKTTAHWRGLGTQAGKCFADMVDFYISAYERNAPYLGGCGLHDPLAVAVALEPDLVETLDLDIMVELEGPDRGRTVGDPRRLGLRSTTKVAVGVDGPRFLSRFKASMVQVLGQAR